MSKKKPSPKSPVPQDLLRELYAAADAFRDAAPWEELSDSDWFAFPDPDTGGEYPVVGAVMGMAGQVFGLCLYRYPEGLWFWNEVFRTGQPSQETGMYRQHMLEVDFVPRADLAPEDLAERKALGLKAAPRSSVGYPSFNSWKPGCFPWFLEESEARLLLQGLQYALAFFENGGLKTAHMDAEDRRRENAEWPHLATFHDLPGKVDYTFAPFPKVHPPHHIAPTDDLFAPRIAALPEADEEWEIDTRPFPRAVGDDGAAANGAPRYFRAVFVITGDGHAHVPDDPDALAMVPFNEPLWPVVQREFSRVAGLRGERPVSAFTASAEVALALSPLVKEIPGFLVGAPDPEEPSGSPLDMIHELIGTGLAPGELDDLLESKEVGDLLSELEQLVGLAEQKALVPALKKKSPRGKHPHAGAHATVRIDLAGMKPPIWRRLRIPLACDFAMLHLIIQEAMGFYDCHLHAFEIREGHHVALRIEPDGSDIGLPFQREITVLESEILLGDVIAQGAKKIHYTYDFGDDWEHILKIESITEDPSLPNEVHLLKGKGPDPVEDCGGRWSLQDMIDGRGLPKYDPEDKDFDFFETA